MTRKRGKPGPDPDYTDEALMARRHTVAQMMFHGKSQVEMARELGVARSTVQDDIKFLTTHWQENALRTLGEHKVQLLAEAENLQATYWDAWVRSTKEATTETVEEMDWPISVSSMRGTVTVDGRELPVKLEGSLPAKRVKASQKVEHPVGDPRFLDGVRQCMEMRAKILGLPLSVPTPTATPYVSVAVGIQNNMSVLPQGHGQGTTEVMVSASSGSGSGEPVIQTQAAPPLGLPGTEGLRRKMRDVLRAARPAVRTSLIDRFQHIVEETLSLDSDLQRMAAEMNAELIEGEARVLPAPPQEEGASSDE